ncbi:Oidioi.mRNA.OKI2018_I69.XSR.g16980.t1.cds [Oikopleura dioica]|uniref:Oidioi.mRNA.OKI2018_I69.XSR.g16980.t1.cds n=1 Tax=Oikopleura dioica TaxID=34765 RepID=A0ABN7SQ35_OIKDI|nr:Oidioi.mRNA.OKI2018_I69.XSR.g16980.t1.cds [Oikopleura dioica]
MNSTWEELNNWVGDDPARKIQFLFGLPGILNTIMLVSLSLIDFVFPAFFRRWAIQDAKKAVPIRRRTWLVLLAFFSVNGILVSGFFAPFFRKFLLRRVEFGPLPKLDRILCEFVAICIVEDAYFYYVHRLSHQFRWFYSRTPQIS